MEQSNANERCLIVTVPSQTGDVYHIAGALALDKNVDVLVICQNETEALDPAFDFYKQAANGDNSRVKSFTFPTTAKFDAAKSLYKILTTHDLVYYLKNPAFSGIRDLWEKTDPTGSKDFMVRHHWGISINSLTIFMVFRRNT